MTLRKRLAALEEKTWCGKEPHIIISTVAYEDKQGETEHLLKRASIFQKGGQHEAMSSPDDEPMEAFRKRVHARCIELFGRLPSGDQKTVRIPDDT